MKLVQKGNRQLRIQDDRLDAMLNAGYTEVDQKTGKLMKKEPVDEAKLLKKEITELKKEITELKKENSELKKENSELKKENAQLKEQLQADTEKDQ